MKLYEKFEVHNNLNPMLWTKDGRLKEEIKEHLNAIVDEFIDYIEIPIIVADIQLVGSNASFNYTNKSDIDLHIIANFDFVNADETLLQALYDTKKAQFNSKYDISIKGMDVELYVQNIKSGIVSNGIYSLLYDQWIKFPQKIENVPQYNITKDVDILKNKIEKALDTQNVEDIQNIINELYLLRKNSIAIEGEYGRGNQIFKEIRNLGLLQELKDGLTKAKSKILSLENLSFGQIINKYE